MRKGRHAARRATIAVALCTLLAWWSGAVAVAQDPYGDVAELYYSPSEGPPGTTIVITGRCLYEGRPADRAFVSMFDEARTHNVVHVSIPVDTNGDVNGTLLVPSSEPPGQYILSGGCNKDDFAIAPNTEAPFTITDATVTTTSTTLPPPTTRPTTTTTAASTTVPTTTAPTTTAPTATTPTTTVASTAPVSGDGPGTALPALAAAGAVVGAAVLLVRHRRRRTPQ